MRTFLVLLLVTFSPAARAETVPDDPAKQEAKKHFEAGEIAYKLGEFRTAIDEWTRSFRSFPAPVLLFDLGQAHRQLGENEKAIFFYHQYLSAAPDGKFAKVAREMIDRLEKLVAEQRGAQKAPPQGSGPPSTQSPAAAAPPPAVKPTSPPPMAAVVPTSPATRSDQPRLWYKDGFGWTLVAAGIAVAGGGSALLLGAGSSADRAASATTVETREALLLQSSGMSAGGYVALGVGAVAIIGGVVRWLLLRRSQRTANLDIHLNLHPARLATALEWNF